MKLKNTWVTYGGKSLRRLLFGLDDHGMDHVGKYPPYCLDVPGDGGGGCGEGGDGGEGDGGEGVGGEGVRGEGDGGGGEGGEGDPPQSTNSG